MMLAFVAVTAVLGASRVRGFASLAIGLTIGLVGIDADDRAAAADLRAAAAWPTASTSSSSRSAIFAVGEALWVAAHLRRTPAEIIPVGRAWMGKEDLKRSWKPWLRGTAFGFPFGALPAGGAEIPTFLSYVTERKLSKRPEEFGHGAIEGVAGPEASNNASAAGTLVPMLALGLPVSATAAVMLAAFQSYGIQPGPAAVRPRAGAGVGSDREPVHRQHAAAGAEPAAGPVLGEAAVDPAARISTRGSCSSPAWARSR